MKAGRGADEPGRFDTWKAGGPSPTLTTFDNTGPVRATVLVADTVGVRSLTHRERERLMGWLDDHTRWGVFGELSPSFRNTAIGNGVASPCAEWIAHRLKEAMQ